MAQGTGHASTWAVICVSPYVIPERVVVGKSIRNTSALLTIFALLRTSRGQLLKERLWSRPDLELLVHPADQMAPVHSLHFSPRFAQRHMALPVLAQPLSCLLSPSAPFRLARTQSSCLAIRVMQTAQYREGNDMSPATDRTGCIPRFRNLLVDALVRS